MYYRTKVTIQLQGEDKPKSYLFLFESPSYGYIEEVAFDKLGPLGEVFGIDSITKTSYNYILRGNKGNIWYSVKVNFFSEDDKKIPAFYMVLADSVISAERIVKEKENLNSSTGEVAEVKETKIVEVYE